jgi:hypothetical protein
MKKKILSTVVISLLLITNAFSQEQKPLKIHELGLTFSNFDNFGIRYKTGNEKTLLRITALAMNINLNNNWGREIDSTDIKNNGYGIGFRIGFEKPIVIVKNFDLLYGVDLIGNFSYLDNKQESPNYNYQSSSWNVSTGVAFVFGGAYRVGDHFRFSAEISPSLQYGFGETKNSSSGNQEIVLSSNYFSFGFSNYGASITVAYRFIK